jgi:hypothetical protein
VTVTNTVAYYGSELVKAIKSFMVQVSGDKRDRVPKREFITLLKFNTFSVSSSKAFSTFFG